MVKCQQPDVFMVDVVSLTMLAFFPRYKYCDANPLLHTTVQIRKSIHREKVSCHPNASGWPPGTNLHMKDRYVDMPKLYG